MLIYIDKYRVYVLRKKQQAFFLKKKKINVKIIKRLICINFV